MITITGGQMPISGGTMTGALAITGGSAAAPGLAVAGDANTGLFSPAENVLAVATGGVERVRIDSAGSVGIGTAAPSVKLHVQTADATPTNSGIFNSSDFVVEDTAIGRMYLLGSQVDIFLDNYLGTTNCKMSQIVNVGDQTKFVAYNDNGTLKHTLVTMNHVIGNVGIGTTGPTAALHLPASTTARASLRIPDGTAPTAPNAGDVWAAGGKLYFYDGATTKEIAFV